MPRLFQFSLAISMASIFQFGLAQEKPASPSDFTFKGDVQLQGEKSFKDGWGNNNLDKLWGRLNFGAEYKEEAFSSKFNIRIFPEGFGFEPVVGASYDTTGVGSVKVATSEQSRTQINHAWVKQSFQDFAIRVGRFETKQTPSYFFGDYVDMGPGGNFGSRGAVHNATEITSENGGLSTSLILGVAEKHLNRGFLRLIETYRNPNGIEASFSFRSNVFDKLVFPDDPIHSRLTLSGKFSKDGKKGVFAEAGMVQRDGADDQFPVLAGIFAPAGKAADKISLEIEYLVDRKVGGEDKPLLWHVYYGKKLFKRAAFDVGLSSDPAAPDAGDLLTSVRFTCGLK